MGGASVAKKLIDAGIDVLIIEAGSKVPGRAPPPIREESVGQSFGLPVTRAFEIGGGTNLWHGICAPFDPIDFEARPWIDESGWPIAYGDLSAFYAEAAAWMDIPTTSAGPDEPPPSMLEFFRPKAFWTCRSPPRMKNVVLEWARAGRMRCLMHAVALELRADDDGVVRSLVIGSGGKILEVEAEVFVIACGGLETPRLLLNSGRGQDMGSGASLIGRYLMDHPAGYFSQIVYRKHQNAAFGSPSMLRSGRLTGLALRPELQERFQLPNHYLFLRPGVDAAKVPNELLRLFLGIRRLGELSSRHFQALLTSRYVRQRIMRERLGLIRASRYGDIYVVAEQTPNPLSRVVLSEKARDEYGYPIARIDWQMRPDEWAHFDSYFALVSRGLRRDARITSVRLDAIEEWPHVLSSAAHHLGTARMAATPKRGVVDGDLRVFGQPNLFICDGSVFPTAGGTNPSLTISALALRLGEKLARSLHSPIVARSAA